MKKSSVQIGFQGTKNRKMISAHQVRYFIPYYRGHADIIRGLRIFCDDYITDFQSAIPYLPFSSCRLHIAHISTNDAVIVYVGVVAEPYRAFAVHGLLVDAAET